MSQKVKVLMVDDEAQFRATTERILIRRGFQTIMAGSGEEAIEKLEQNPDVIILDINLPGMSGHDTLRKIKRIKPDLPVIMLTGYGALPSAKEAQAVGAFDYLVKPCDIDTLAAKIVEAHKHRAKEEDTLVEKSVRDVMIPIEEYTTLNQQSTIKEAIDKLRESFSAKVSTSRIMETGHRSIVVFDDHSECIGILAIIDLLQAIMPGYLSAPKPSMADSIQYSPLFWTGLFRREVMGLASKQIKAVMSPAPSTIDADANLMEAAYTMVYQNKRRLAAMDSGKIIGIIREQDLFFEIERILREPRQ